MLTPRASSPIVTRGELRTEPARPEDAPSGAPDRQGPPELSVILPAYNSAAYVAKAIRELHLFFEAEDISGEVVVADDGSADGTAAVAVTLGESTRLKVVRLPFNRGKGAALRAGMLASSGKVRVFTDADLPYGTEPIRLALHYIRSRRFHAVIGDRTLPGSKYRSAALARRMISSMASVAFRTLVTGGIYDTQCGFKAFRGDVAVEVFSISRIDRFAIDVELIYLLLKYRLDIKRIPVRLQRNSTSSVQVIRDTAEAVRDIARMRFNWFAGRYRSRSLRTLLADDLRRDKTEAEMAPAAHEYVR